MKLNKLIYDSMPAHVQQEVQDAINSYNRLREYYLSELEFQIPLLKQVEKMAGFVKKYRGDTFLGFNTQTAESIRKLEMLQEYLIEFPDSWDPRYYDKVIASIPKFLDDDKKLEI